MLLHDQVLDVFSTNCRYLLVDRTFLILPTLIVWQVMACPVSDRYSLYCHHPLCRIQDHTQILSLLTFIPFLAMLNFKNILIILIEEKKRILNKATWISTLVMITISVIFSYLHGGLGLAIALLFSEIFSFIVHSILLSNHHDKK